MEDKEEKENMLQFSKETLAELTLLQTKVAECKIKQEEHRERIKILRGPQYGPRTFGSIEDNIKEVLALKDKIKNLEYLEGFLVKDFIKTLQKSNNVK